MKKASAETTVVNATLIAVAARQGPLTAASPVEVTSGASTAPDTAAFAMAATAAGPGLQADAEVTLTTHVR